MQVNRVLFGHHTDYDGADPWRINFKASRWHILKYNSRYCGCWGLALHKWNPIWIVVSAQDPTILEIVMMVKGEYHTTNRIDLSQPRSLVRAFLRDRVKEAIVTYEERRLRAYTRDANPAVH